MKNNQKITNETQIETAIGWLLRVGVFAAVTVMLIGIILFFLHGNTGYGQTIPSDLSVLFKGIIALKAGAWIMLGIFILILTPTIRVFASIFAFLAVKDHLYAGITTLVFLILLLAAFIGLQSKF
ncbi:DUF1634 domain-containing protein [Oenococcus sicerae]|uniref:DUF1634 domain-containing protein n=1 Tax=Oenococcus sicerae TaxID=2203724 RepID=UPI0010B93BA6|nr:hypothetical protein OAL24_00318 [Oenococcus sicerae]